MAEPLAIILALVFGLVCSFLLAIPSSEEDRTRLFNFSGDEDGHGN